ncbi:uncharacterized protein TNCV_3245871 [Trichonephila clavipes]|nr:uncharacterized protein TNCV_3245871 [Trichonephila clavipes]
MWRRISNFELHQSYEESVIVNFIKVQRIKWAGHVVRMDEDSTTKKIFTSQPIGTLTWKVLEVQPGKGFLSRLRPILGCQATEEGRKI